MLWTAPPPARECYESGPSSRHPRRAYSGRFDFIPYSRVGPLLRLVSALLQAANNIIGPLRSGLFFCGQGLHFPLGLRGCDGVWRARQTLVAALTSFLIAVFTPLNLNAYDQLTSQ